jgi:hypothetical protein
VSGLLVLVLMVAASTCSHCDTHSVCPLLSVL